MKCSKELTQFFITQTQPRDQWTGDPDLSDFSVPLMDMGLDSLSAVEFRNRVQAQRRSVQVGDSYCQFEYTDES